MAYREARMIPYYGQFLCDVQVRDLQMKINQASGDQSVRGAIYYDITMDNDIAWMPIVTSQLINDVTMDIHCDVTMSNNVAMCTYHGITMHDFALYFYYVLLGLFMLFYYGKYGITIRTCSCLISLGNTFVVFV